MSEISSVLSSPPPSLRTASPASEFAISESQYAESTHSEFTEQYPIPSNSAFLLPANVPTAPSSKKRRHPPQSSWVWGPPESQNGKLVTVEEIL